MNFAVTQLAKRIPRLPYLSLQAHFSSSKHHGKSASSTSLPTSSISVHVHDIATSSGSPFTVQPGSGGSFSRNFEFKVNPLDNPINHHSAEVSLRRGVTLEEGVATPLEYLLTAFASSTSQVVSKFIADKNWPIVGFSIECQWIPNHGIHQILSLQYENSSEKNHHHSHLHAYLNHAQKDELIQHAASQCPLFNALSKEDGSSDRGIMRTFSIRDSEEGEGGAKTGEPHKTHHRNDGSKMHLKTPSHYAN